MARKILIFYYVNENRALYGMAHDYSILFHRKGYAAETFNLAQPDVNQQLDRLLHRDQIAFCLAAQGVGSRLGNQTQTIWAQRRIPFIGIHGDNPCYNIFNHFSDTSYVANLYLYESFADIHRRYIHTDQVVDTMPFQVGSLHPSPIPFQERPIKILYLKSGESTAECEAQLNALPPPLRDAAWQQIDRIKTAPNLSSCDLVQDIFTALKIDRAGQFDLFWGIAYWMDMYIRRKRAIDFVNWLKQQDGAVIVGNGWDFIDRAHARALFKPAIDITETHGLYWQTRFVCNTSPYGPDIVHERVPIGLYNNSIVLTDTNPWLDRYFGDVPQLVRFDWNHSLDDQLQPTLSLLSEEAITRLDTGRARALSLFSGFDIVAKMLDTVKRIDPACVPKPYDEASP
jgi:hypothetical protein